jgi:hypothetical protein
MQGSRDVGICPRAGIEKSHQAMDSRLRGNDNDRGSEMRSCSVCKKLEVVRGVMRDYEQLAHYHYRDERLGPFAAIFALKPKGALTMSFGTEAVGVIVYAMPTRGVELRDTATGNLFAGLDKATRLALINKNVRCIRRVIIEPRFRGLGLASRLVRETMPQMGVPIIEAMAVMGRINPFFAKAGMKAYAAKMPVRCVRLIEALSTVGIEKGDLIDAGRVQGKLDSLSPLEADFLEREIRHFLQSYGKRRDMPGGPERTRYILSKLTARPVYYVWFNQNLELRI